MSSRSRKFQYTVPIEQGMRVRHDAQARFTVSVKVKGGQRILEDRLTDVDLLGAAMTQASIIYNALSYSGGVSWWDPKTGASLAYCPTVKMRLRPQDVLTGDQECGCSKCSEEVAA